MKIIKDMDDKTIVLVNDNGIVCFCPFKPIEARQTCNDECPMFDIIKQNNKAFPYEITLCCGSKRRIFIKKEDVLIEEKIDTSDCGH